MLKRKIRIFILYLLPLSLLTITMINSKISNPETTKNDINAKFLSIGIIWNIYFNIMERYLNVHTDL